MDWLSYCYVPQMGHTPVREGLTYRIVRVQERQKVWRAPTTVMTTIRDVMVSVEESGCIGRKRSLIDMIQHFITSSEL